MAGPGGVRLAAYRFGGHGPPLLLVHATGFHAHVWLPMLDELRARFTVFAFDLRGHGESAPAPDPGGYHYGRMGADVVAVARHFGLEAVAAIGHSVGGALVVQAELLRPGLVERAVLFEPIVLPPTITEESAAVAAARRRRHAFASTAEMLAGWSRRPPFAGLDPEALRCYVEYGVRDRPEGGVVLKCSREAEVATFREDVRSGIWGALGRYRTPTLIVTGERSTSRAAPVADAQARAMGDARVERVAGLSHFLPLERPQAMARLALGFLAPAP